MFCCAVVQMGALALRAEINARTQEPRVTGTNQPAQQNAMCTTVCKTCPFVNGPNAYGYDDDAMFALKTGAEPSCHSIVGLDSIFVNTNEENICAGFVAWTENRRGFRRPKRVKNETTQEIQAKTS